MPRVQRTAQADEDLIELWVYVAQDNEFAADHLWAEFDRKFALLAGQPRLGAARPDIAPELRHFPVGRYLILYREIDDGIEVVRIVHGARQLNNLF